MDILRSIRNWPKKLVCLHKTDHKISELNTLISALKDEVAAIKPALSALRDELLDRERTDKIAQIRQKLTYQNLINLCCLMPPVSDKGNLFALVKKYFDHLDAKEYQFFIDLATDYQTGVFTSHHYCKEAFQQKLGEHSSAFLTELNRDYLTPQQLEITANHGISRTFRFWSSDEKQSYIHFANDVSRILRGFSEYVCFGYGTALAAARNGRFIPHDDDIDIIVYIPRTCHTTRAEAFQHLKHFLLRQDMVVREVFPTHLKVIAPDGHELDIFVAIEKNGLLDCRPGPREYFRVDTLFPTQRAQLEGIECDVPGKLETYLCALYGQDWKMPDENFHHDWREWE